MYDIIYVLYHVMGFILHGIAILCIIFVRPNYSVHNAHGKYIGNVYTV